MLLHRTRASRPWTPGSPVSGSSVLGLVCPPSYTPETSERATGFCDGRRKTQNCVRACELCMRGCRPYWTRRARFGRGAGVGELCSTIRATWASRFSPLEMENDGVPSCANGPRMILNNFSRNPLSNAIARSRKALIRWGRSPAVVTKCHRIGIPG